MNMKKSVNNLTRLCLMVLAFVTLSTSCSKEGIGDNGLSGKSGLSMKVDGESWDSWMTTMFTEKHESSEHREYYLVSLVGSRVIENNSATEDDFAESITMMIAIPASEFQNPKGTYPIVWESDVALNQAWAVFGTSTDIRDATTYGPSPSGQSGTIEITGFETGQQTILGQPTGLEGYTKLSGTFRMELLPLEKTGNTLKITEGTFNLKGGMEIGI